MRNLRNYINEFKLRASYGSVGNQNIADYSYFAVMSPTIPNWQNNSTSVTSLTMPGLISTDFTWETVSTFDVGADWGFLKNKLTGTFDWYTRTTKNILTANPTPAPALLGTGLPLQNSGALRTNGFELQINWKDRIGKVNYYVGLNLYNYMSVVTKSANATGSINNLYVGQKIGNIWGYTTERLFTADDFLPGTLDANLKNGTLKPGLAKFANQNPNPGDVMYKDYNGDSIINGGNGTLSDPGDERIIGNSTPKYQFGFNGGVSYKGFSLSFFIEGVMKRDLWVANPLIFPNYYYTYSSLFTNELNYWTPARPQAYYGRIYTDDATGGAQKYNQETQTRFLQNGAFVRLKNVTLNYSLPASICSKIHASRLQIFYSMENVLTLDHMPKGMYPDVANAGSSTQGGAGYPFLRKSSVGIYVSF